MNGRATRRVVVTAPRGNAGPVDRRARRTAAERTELSSVYLRSLVRSQLRLGLFVCASTCGVLALLPLVFELAPAIGAVSVFGLRLPWLLLGVLCYPALVFAGWRYVRRAERNEREFAESVEKS